MIPVAAIFRLDPRVPTEILIILLLLGVLIFLWDLFDRKSRKIQTQSGLSEKGEVVALRGSSYLQAKEYRSERLGLTSKPYAVLKEDGFIIPVEIAPLGKKVKDRHVVQMLVHLKLIEELEGKRPPYGLLLMGHEQRTVRIKNTDDKQRWLDSLLDEMRSILGGVPAVPAPTFYKCKGCDVRKLCAYSAFKESASPSESPEEMDTTEDA